MGVGKEATRKGLVESGGVKVIGDEIEGEPEAANQTLIKAVDDALISLRTPSDQPISLDPESEADTPVIVRLRETFGDYFARRFMSDGEWVKGILPGPGG